MLASAAWPQAESGWINEAAEQRFGMLQELIGGIREARGQHGVPNNRAVRVTIAAEGDAAACVSDNAAVIAALCGAEEVRVDASATASGTDATVVAGGMRALVHDVIDPEAERTRLAKQAETLAKGIRGIEGKLGNADFVDRAPAEVVQRERERLVRLQGELAVVEDSLKAIQ